MRGLRKLRRALYASARVLGDLSAVASGRPGKVAKRMVNKLVGRGIVRRLFWR